MNEKFYDLPKQKQEAMINGAMHVFSLYNYAKASTDEIASAAGVSKALIFHYFGNKRELYLFLYDYALKFITEEMRAIHNYNETDFFEILKDAQMAKIRILSKHPDVIQFAAKAYCEESEAVKCFIDKSVSQVAADSSARFLSRADYTKFKDNVKPNEVLNLILWFSDGYMKSRTPEQRRDLVALNNDFLHYIDLLKEHFYKEEYLK